MLKRALEYLVIALNPSRCCMTILINFNTSRYILGFEGALIPRHFNACKYNILGVEGALIPRHLDACKYYILWIEGALIPRHFDACKYNIFIVEEALKPRHFYV